MTLTKPQIKLFYRIPRDGVLAQNSKARSMVEALEKAGLVSVEVTPRRGAYPGYTLRVLKCKHGRWKSPSSAGCDACWDEAHVRCPTCGRFS
jgi:hypothetical protein